MMLNKKNAIHSYDGDEKTLLIKIESDHTLLMMERDAQLNELQKEIRQ